MNGVVWVMSCTIKNVVDGKKKLVNCTVDWLFHLLSYFNDSVAPSHSALKSK